MRVSGGLMPLLQPTAHSNDFPLPLAATINPPPGPTLTP